MLVAAIHQPTAVLDGGQVDQRIPQRLPVQVDLPVDAQACNAAIRIDVETHVCPKAVMIDLMQVLGVSLQRHRWQNLGPFRAFVWGIG